MEGERLFAFLDDIYVICKPERVADVHNVLERCLFHHARIHVHHGKTKMWNRSGRRPTGVDELTPAARLEDPEAVVWRGDQSLETKVQGFKVLGAPIGHPDFAAEFLAKKSREHEVLFDRIPAMEDLQSAWLVLEMVAEFAESHDANTWGVWHD